MPKNEQQKPPGYEETATVNGIIILLTIINLMALRDIIIREITEHGPLTFHDFMERALYFPGLGYYNSPGDKIGKEGDFFTSPAYTGLFGEMIGKQIAEMVWVGDGNKKFTILEFGAGQGLLCLDILSYLRTQTPYGSLVQYCILEKSSELRRRQQERLPKHVRWIDDVAELKPFNGCILANEVLDNFAVHIVKREAGTLWELQVDYKNGELVEGWQPASAQLYNYVEALQVDLPEGCRIEVNLEALAWLEMISQVVEKGFIVLVDYGGTSRELYTTARETGTLLCFHKHQINFAPFRNIGRQDITAQVNFSAIADCAGEYGLELAGYTSQANFLLALGFSAELRKLEMAGRKDPALARQLDLIQTFFLEMGTKIKVMILQKGFEKVRLTGMQFSDLKLQVSRQRV